MNEVQRLWLPNRGQHVQALLRDIGFVSVSCGICNERIRSGMFVIVPKCKDTFHHSCFVDALAPAPEPNPQDAQQEEQPRHAEDCVNQNEANEAEEGGPTQKAFVPLCCPKCSIPIGSVYD
mmetsp:Transcript_24428/g.42746  ORF Transcript_24428/g.42746 Transcript_24428/m.42746 type:complete len:121 (+) Transcript_24428:78-440(+)